MSEKAPKKIPEGDLNQRRRAQNRAAQRAFRERKEGKLKELGDKLALAEEQRLKLEKELNEIKQRNILLDLENQFLQQQSDKGTTTTNSTSPMSEHITQPDTSNFQFPSKQKSDFILGSIDYQKHNILPENILESSQYVGESYQHEEDKVLTISAVWDYIMEFSNLNENITVDVPGIMLQLKGKEVCHGFGPAYPIGVINDIIMDNVDMD
ncbi:Yap3 protein [Martiniozyma asiatica (nom. inval.)]|nr:Yap3 protein [Martiniozyma asiatica]